MVNTRSTFFAEINGLLGIFGTPERMNFPRERWGFPVSSHEFRNLWRNPSIFQAPNAELCGKHLELKGLRPRWAVGEPGGTRWKPLWLVGAQVVMLIGLQSSVNTTYIYMYIVTIVIYNCYRLKL